MFGWFGLIWVFLFVCLFVVFLFVCLFVLQQKLYIYIIIDMKMLDVRNAVAVE